MSKSSIEWTEETWNPITGCFKVSTGCKNCYAEVMSKRLQKMSAASSEKYAGILDERGNFNGVINFSEKALLEPLKKKKPTMYFLSMSDLFHENVKWEWIDKIFAVMALTPHHTYQILTKRPERMLEYFNTGGYCIPIGIRQEIQKMGYEDIGAVYKEAFLKNVWLGTSVENQTQANKRIPYLLQVPAAIHFLSCEPLLGGLDLTCIYDKENDLVIDSLTGDVFYTPKGTDMLSRHSETDNIDWVIVGGESGHNARPMHPSWAISIRNQCKEAKVPFFFKQWGTYLPLFQKNGVIVRKSDILINEYGEQMLSSNIEKHRGRYVGFAKVGKSEAGNLLEGQTYLEMPNHD